MSPTWKAVVGIILVFILGWFGGAVTTLIIARHKALAIMQRGPEALAVLLERQTTRNLGLNGDQKTRLHALFLENLKQRMELQKQVQPQVKTVNRQTLQDVDAVLTPDQQQRFRDNLVLFKARFGRNPFNTGIEDKGAETTPRADMGTDGQMPATNAPSSAQ